MKMFTGLALVLAIATVGRADAQHCLSLADSKRLALENNAACVKADLEVEAARQIKKAAFTKFFPNISAGGVAWKTNENLLEIESEGGDLPVYDGDPANLGSATQFAYLPGGTIGLLEKGRIGWVTAVQPVFAGGRIVNGNQLAALGVKVGEDKRRLARDQIELHTEELYWQVVSLQEKERTIDSFERMLLRLHEQVDYAFEAGIALKNDMLKVGVELGNVRLTQSKLTNGRAVTLMALCQFIGIEYEEDLFLDEPLRIDDSPSDYFISPDEGLKRRTEYALLDKSIRAERLATRLKRGEFLPQVGVGGTWSAMKLDDTGCRDIAMIFGTVSVPLSGWWGGSHELKERAARERIAETNFADSSELLTLQIEKAYRDLSDAFLQVQLSLATEAQAEENLSVGRDSYDNGLTLLTDVLDAMAWRQRARDEVTQAKAGYMVKRRIYLQSTGR